MLTLNTYCCAVLHMLIHVCLCVRYCTVNRIKYGIGCMLGLFIPLHDHRCQSYRKDGQHNNPLHPKHIHSLTYSPHSYTYQCSVSQNNLYRYVQVQKYIHIYIHYPIRTHIHQQRQQRLHHLSVMHIHYLHTQVVGMHYQHTAMHALKHTHHQILIQHTNNNNEHAHTHTHMRSTQCVLYDILYIGSFSLSLSFSTLSVLYISKNTLYTLSHSLVYTYIGKILATPFSYIYFIYFPYISMFPHIYIFILMFVFSFNVFSYSLFPCALIQTYTHLWPGPWVVCISFIKH